MARGRVLAKLVLSEAEREQLQAMVRGSKTSQALGLRARIVLASAEARSNDDIARQLKITPQTVGKWRSRFIEKRLAGLTDEPRPGPPRKLSDAAVSVLLTSVLAVGGAGTRRWTSRTLAASLGVSQSTVSRVLRGMGVRLHVPDPYRESLEPHYVHKVRDIVGLYIDSPIRAIVLCVDDKRTATASETAVRWQPASAVLPARHALPHLRHGDRTLLQALDDATCGSLGSATRGAGVRTFLDFLKTLDAAVPTERAVHVVIDDKGRRKRPTIDQWFGRKPRFRVLMAPSCEAWLAQVERWLALLVQRQSREGGESATALENAVREFLAQASRMPFSWSKTRRDVAALPASAVEC